MTQCAVLTCSADNATKEIILSAGAFDSPKLLKLSGVGPHEELTQFGIDVVHELPGVGENLVDHPNAGCVLVLNDQSDGVSPLYSDSSALDAARKQFVEGGDGPLSVFNQHMIMGWFKHDDVFESDEFKGLHEAERSYISQPTIPTAEILSHINLSSHGLDPRPQYLMVTAVGLVLQSRGTVKLASADPKVPAVVDPAWLSHPFDKRTMISSLRHIMQLFESPAIKSRTLMAASVPKSTSDEDILEHMRQGVSSTYHPACTVKMGKIDDEMACLDADFRVRGLKNLRVADLSSLPFLLNCLPQAVAYLVGQIAADKIIAEYSS